MLPCRAVSIIPGQTDNSVLIVKTYELVLARL